MNVKSNLPSGTRFQVSWDDQSAVSGVNTSALFAAGGSVARALQVGTRGYFDRACEHVVPSTLRSRSAYGAFELLRAVGNDGLVTTACLRGKHHDIMTIFGGPPVTEVQILAAFAGLNYIDAPLGVTMTPQVHGRQSLASEDLSIGVDGRGLIYATTADEALRTLPNSRGGTTSAGAEIWRRESDGDGPRGYVLGFRNACLEVRPWSQGMDESSEWQDWLQSLKAEAA